MKTLRYIAFILSILLTIILSAPFCLLRPFSQKNNLIFTRICLFFAKPLMWLEIKTLNPEVTWSHHPAIVVSNHQHNFDILIGDRFFDDKFAVIGKKQLGYIPFFGQMFALAGNILLDRSKKEKAVKAMNEMLQKVIDKKLSLLIFPEGTRNKTKELLDFKKGAFHMAKNANLPLIPISVSHYNDAISKFKKLKIKIKVHSPISVEKVQSMNLDELSDYTKKIIQNGIIELNQS